MDFYNHFIGPRVPTARSALIDASRAARARDHRADHVSLPLQVSPRRRHPRSGTRHTGGR